MHTQAAIAGTSARVSRLSPSGCTRPADQMAAAPRHPRSFIAYASVHFGKSLLWAAEDGLTLYILVRLLAVPPTLAGTVFLASSLWNALCDGMFGSVLGHRTMSPALIVSVAAIAIGGCSLGFVALPFVATGDTTTALLLLLLFRTGFSLVDVPHNALTAIIIGRGEHLRIARVRAIGSSMAGIVVGIASIPLLAGKGSAAAVSPVIVGIGLVSLILMLPLPFLLARNAESVCAKRGRDDASPGWGDAGLWLFALASMIGFAGLAAMGKALLHLGFTATGLGAAALLLVTAGRLASVWLWSPLARRIGHQASLAAAYAACSAAALLMPLLLGAGPLGIVLLLCAYGLAVGGVALLCWALLSEALDRTRAGLRQTSDAFTFGLFTMSMKTGLGLSALFVGLWLAVDGETDGIDAAALWPLSLTVAASCLAATVLPLVPRYGRLAFTFVQSTATGLHR